ncbi:MULTISPECIES: toll/interleukin-1 receptor domain-containing protein [unclassified Streptomyces]|uniref:toll/interleukin-1 receptor domain-containing protein n=1 Tax=unclassified Streptomyces TaxID=2593676 RepID=UPI0036FE59D3
MPEIFINYRTGDGDHLAATLDEALRHRFGDHAVFRDGRSIQAGAEYPCELLGQLRRSRAVLVVMGPAWATAEQLWLEDDWVRREILEARECRIPLVPVLADPSVRWLRRDQLPPELAWLAELQALRYTPYHAARDLAFIGDELLALVPELIDGGHHPADAPSTETSNSVTGGRHGTVVQGRDFGGDIAGTIYKGNTGPFHTGSGDQYVDSPRFSGDGATYIAGDNTGGVRHLREPGHDRRRDGNGRQ